MFVKYENFDEKPNESEECEIYVYPNIKFQDWVVSTFNVTIPDKATEVVKHPNEMDDKKSHDDFWNWVNKNCA